MRHLSSRHLSPPPPPSTAFHLPPSTATAATLAGAHLRSAHNRHDRRYFVVFTRPHSGADFLCKLLNRHPEITCAGELSNPNPNHNPNQSRSVLPCTLTLTLHQHRNQASSSIRG